MRWVVKLLTVLQLIIAVGACLLNYLATHSMGVMRHLTMLNHKWSAAVNLDILLIILLALMLLCPLWRLLRHATVGVASRRHWWIQVIIWLAVLYFAVLFYGDNLRAYYQLMCLFYLILIIQCIKGWMLDFCSKCG
jgi:hypothetical protein